MLILSAIIITIVLIILGVFFLKNTGKRFSRKQIEADAIILGVQLTGSYKKSNPQVILQLQVQPEQDKNFIIDIKEILNITDFSFMQPGAKLRVNYNPYNHKRVSVIKNVS